MNDLFRRYDVPAPRYTSYPTVPFWSDPPTTAQWLDSLRRALTDESLAWSIYLHLPFCETLCTYCACNTVITRDHGREDGYVGLMNREWELYCEAVPDLLKRPLRQLHLGGGTPTFFSPDNLRRILGPMLEQTVIDASNFDASIEVDPRRTTKEHMAALHELGFRRISLGVQDFDPEVQRIVNRLQPFEETARVTNEARALGYDSVNFDLIYGLPKQTAESIVMTAKHTLELRPDRIALYSFALVPWIKPTQRSYHDDDIPKAGDKRKLYELARELLLDGGYVEIGMDHFALPHDQLALAADDGSLHRNFMGYTEMRTRVMLGMGVSAISETPDCFHQNEKAFPVYEKKLQQGQLPTLRGHRLDAEDRSLREQILAFMTRFAVELTPEQQQEAPEFLASMLGDGLVELEGTTLRLTDTGLPFLRNACMFFDQRLRRQQPTSRIFSQAM
ncbi:MAG: oxygen-independent coproporphyrinogen III oxidase [Blastocatellia bacterium]|jgi:oxygen-independent coproporphyrinogen-3 oxidase